MTPSFIPVAILPITMDAPCFATPLFRDEHGAKFYLQNVWKRKRILDFQYVGPDAFSADSYIPYRRNKFATVGDDMLVGFRFEDGTSYVDTKANLIHHLVERAEDFRENFPWFCCKI